MISSESISTLAAALVKAQKAFAPAIKTAVNPHFKSKYVDLASAIEAAQPALLDNGIAVIQGTKGCVAETSVTVTTRLLHESGEWLEDSLTLPATNRGDFSAQSAGSAITYARRYSYMAILGFAPEDDDGNGASNGQQDTQRAKPFVPAAAEVDYRTQMERSRPVGSSLNQQLRASIATNPDAEDAGDPNDYDVHMDQREQPKPQLVRREGPVISEKQGARFFAIAIGSGRSKPEINHYLASRGYADKNDILKSEYDELCAWAGAK